jgi:hypothetical protein
MGKKNLRHAKAVARQKQMEAGGVLRRVPMNVSVHPVAKDRGVAAVEALGYNMSEFVEQCLERVHEVKQNGHLPGSPLTFTFIDRQLPPINRGGRKKSDTP